MENQGKTSDLSSTFPIGMVIIKRDEAHNYMKAQHSHSHGGKPCDGNHGHSQQQSDHGHSHQQAPQMVEYEKKSEDHGHSHNKGKQHGHSHSQHGHSHGEEDEECEEDHSNEEEEDDHHGHSHNHGQHGHSHEGKNQKHGHGNVQPQQHGHSHNGKPCHGHGNVQPQQKQHHGHSHDQQPQQHGHSHNGKPCHGHGNAQPHKAPVIFNFIHLSTTAFLNISKLKQYLGNDSKRNTFEEWWGEQKKNQSARQRLEERLFAIIESVKDTGEFEESELSRIAPDLFDIPMLLGEKSTYTREDVIEQNESKKDLLTLIEYFIDFHEECRKILDPSGQHLIQSFIRIMCYCALVIPLIEEATGEALTPQKSFKKKYNAVCEKHKERYLVHPYTSEWTCFQCYPTIEDQKVANTFFNFNNFYRSSLANYVGFEGLCFDHKCKYCPLFLQLGLHEKRGMIRIMPNINDVICPGCGKTTGKTKSGLVSVEIHQRHTENCKDKRYQESIPSSNCGCKVHTTFNLICSLKCHKKCQFPFNEQTKDVYSQASQRMVTYTRGPLAMGCFHYDEKGVKILYDMVPKKVQLENSCNVCGKADSKACSRCKTTFYCGIECQKKDWQNHKNVCKPN